MSLFLFGLEVLEKGEVQILVQTKDFLSRGMSLMNCSLAGGGLGLLPMAE